MGKEQLQGEKAEEAEMSPRSVSTLTEDIPALAEWAAPSDETT